ncbi:MAG: NUDIX domain-containing protein [Candidatus Saccharimonadales bacterium]
MHDDELWQVYAQNGEPVIGDGRKKETFLDGTLNGAAHVWVWRRIGDDIEVLLQERSKNIISWPGYFDISAAGHINLGETPADAGVREAKEEIGIVIGSDALDFVFAHRKYVDKEQNITAKMTELHWVYAYEVASGDTFVFDDGEVTSTHWLEGDNFPNSRDEAAALNMVPHSNEYFSQLSKHFRTKRNRE